MPYGMPGVVTDQDLVQILKRNDPFAEVSVLQTLQETGLRGDEVRDSLIFISCSMCLYVCMSQN